MSVPFFRLHKTGAKSSLNSYCMLVFCVGEHVECKVCPCLVLQCSTRMCASSAGRKWCCMACFISHVELGVVCTAFWCLFVAVFVDFPLFSGPLIRASCEKSCQALDTCSCILHCSGIVWKWDMMRKEKNVARGVSRKLPCASTVQNRRLWGTCHHCSLHTSIGTAETQRKSVHVHSC